MNGLRAIVAACLLIPAATEAATPACERLERQRERVEQELRRGYATARGNRLRQRLRELNTEIAHNCR